MGILLGLLTAVTWGGSDFCARFAARRIGALRTTLYMQLVGLLLLTIFLPYIGGWGHLTDGSGWRPWAWGALAGVVSGVSNLALYRSFEIGKMAVVATLSASYPALTLLLSLLTGERLTGIRAAGLGERLRRRALARTLAHRRQRRRLEATLAGESAGRSYRVAASACCSGCWAPGSCRRWALPQRCG